ncbi:MAG: AI-2E family transporter, partial [Deltaproteobacteria bacterium]
MALFFLVLLLGYLSYQILKPFISSIAWAIVLSIVFYPVYAFLLKYLKWQPLTSLTTLLLIILVIFGPFSYLSYLLTQEANSLIEHLKNGHFDTVEKLFEHPIISNILNKISSFFNMSTAELQKTVFRNISSLGNESMGIIKSGLGNVASAA